MRAKLKKYLLVGAVTLAALLVIPFSDMRIRDPKPDSDIVCILDVQDHPGGKLTAGLNLKMLRKFCDDNGIRPYIRTRKKDENCLDSLRAAAVDLVVMFRNDTLMGNGIIASKSFNDSTVWVIRDDHVRELRVLNTWISDFTASSLYRTLSRDYLRGEDVSLSSISPYDDLIRKSARDIGWDWRLLSSIVFHESRFNITANSSRGAVGLMQIRSDKYSADTLLDPAVNLSIGSTYLSRLEEMFGTYAADTTERVKFALAAFNAGEGRILQCIKFAQEHGVDPSRWDNIVELIPEMTDFHGKQTIAYVNGVLDTYEEYSRMYPD